MYDQGFKNQAVKECVNGSSIRGTAIKYGISNTALRLWVNDYKNKIAIMEGNRAVIEEPEPQAEDVSYSETVASISLNAIKVNIDGHDVTLQYSDVEKLMEMFIQFNE